MTVVPCCSLLSSRTLPAVAVADTLDQGAADAGVFARHVAGVANERAGRPFYATLPAEQADRILDPRLRNEVVVYYKTAFKVSREGALKMDTGR